MKRENFLWMSLGLIIGLGAMIYAPSIPKQDKCLTYKVGEKTAISYVLKPVVIKEKCEPIIKEVAQVCEIPKKEESVDVTEEKPERHRRRHRRYRRYWK